MTLHKGQESLCTWMLVVCRYPPDSGPNPIRAWRTRPTRGGTWRFAAAAGSLDREDLKEKFTEEDRTKAGA